MSFEFVEFPKMARLSREIVITEKLDGTNAQVLIAPGYKDARMAVATWFDEDTCTDMVMLAGSRSRWITPEDDNYGFARWVRDNAGELARLGIGSHFGEWWGAGIQRKYSIGEKRFSLFNVSRWDRTEARPACCDVVPTLYRGMFDQAEIQAALDRLQLHGSVASPGFMNPEGVVIFHTAANLCFKKTLHKDEVPKALANAQL